MLSILIEDTKADFMQTIINFLLQVAQVAAKTLGISLDHIIIKPSNVLVNANGDTTGGSITSELSCLVCFVWLLCDFTFNHVHLTGCY